MKDPRLTLICSRRATWQHVQSKAMDNRAAKAVRLRWLLCFVSLAFVKGEAMAQEPVRQVPWRMVTDLTVLTVEQEKAYAANPGSDFKECVNDCPVMIVMPSGKFIMGSPENEPDR